MFEKKLNLAGKSDELGQTPAVMNPHERRTYSDLVMESRVQAARWFCIALIEALVILAMGVGIDLMTPLVKTVPYMVKIDADSGQVLAKPVAAEPFVVEPRFVAAEARSFVRNLMSIDPFLSRRDLERASTRVAGKASAEFKEFLLTERPFERMAKTPGLIRTTEINSADASQKNIVFVFAQTSERISVGAPIVTKWRFTIHYVLDSSLDQKGFEENPLGFVITHFERLQDNVQ